MAAAMTSTEECAKCGTVGPVDVACSECRRRSREQHRARKIEAKQAGRAWAERRALEVRDQADPAHGIFDASWVYVGDLGEDGWCYAYLAAAAAAHWWGKRRKM